MYPSKGRDMQVRALAGLAPYLPQSWLPEVLAASQSIMSDGDRVKTLTRLIPHLPESLKGSAVREALTAVLVIRSGDDQAEMLVGLTPYLSKPLLRKALAARG